MKLDKTSWTLFTHVLAINTGTINMHVNAASMSCTVYVLDECSDYVLYMYNVNAASKSCTVYGTRYCSFYVVYCICST